MSPRDEAHDVAVAALARRALTVSELRDRLARRRYDGSIVETVIAELIRSGLVDERALAYNLARRRADEGRRGPARVVSELLARGLSRDLAHEAVNEAFGGGAAGEALAQAFRRLTRGGLPAERPGRDRLVRQLVRAGFAADQVLALLERTGADADELPSLPEDLT